MNKNHSKIDKNKQEEISSGKGLKMPSKKKIFKETGKIIANPLIYKDYDYFSED